MLIQKNPAVFEKTPNMSDQENPKMARKLNLDIQALRGISVLSVMLDHRYILMPWDKNPFLAGLDPFFGFWIGVDIFFAISGFVIAQELLPNFFYIKTSYDLCTELAKFWVKRVFRILPTAWFMIASTLAIAAFFNNTPAWGNFEGNFKDAMASLANVMNFHAWAFIYHVIPPPYGAGLFGALWSLSVEEQFYIILPFLIYFLGQRFLKYFILLVCVAQIFLYRPGASFLWFIRSDALFLGVAIAMTLSSSARTIFEPRFLGKSTFLRYMSCSFLLILILSLSKTEIIWFATGLVAILAGILVWIASFDKKYLLPDSFLKRILVWIGTRSYSIYIFHIPIYHALYHVWCHFEGAQQMPRKYHLYYLGGTIFLVCILSSVSYKFLEQPMRKWGRRIADSLAVRNASSPLEAIHAEKGAMS